MGRKGRTRGRLSHASTTDKRSQPGYQTSQHLQASLLERTGYVQRSRFLLPNRPAWVESGKARGDALANY